MYQHDQDKLYIRRRSWLNKLKSPVVLVLIQSSKIHLHYSGVGCLYSALALWDLGPLTLSGDRRRPDREYSGPHSPRAPSCRCCLVSASKGSGVLIGPKCDRQNPTTGYMVIYIYGHIEMTVTVCTMTPHRR